MRTSAVLSLFAGLMIGHTSVALPGLTDTMTVHEDAPVISGLLGFNPGERHPHHHELARFYRTLAESSEHMQVETIGQSFGGRDHLLAYFGSAENLEKLKSVREGRISASRNGDGPVVVWLGYSVHGNEASGASAAPIVAWYLAHGNDAQVQEWRDNLVVVMEPFINPDGLDRFAHWVNMHRGNNPNADPNDREHNEAWPRGRTSYYWFDLNRDWLPLTHLVSQQRIQHYRQWRPHVLTDAHEMGRGSSYFFQPGIPERNNPATPEKVFELTQKIAEFHADILDESSTLYYARESFDDYYLGKGSTYPDVTGGIGILFEQGSARGHVMETPYGKRTFADAVSNQVQTSISTLRGSLALRDELIENQRQFFSRVRDDASSGGWILADDGDPARAQRLLATLIHHGITVKPVAETVTVQDQEFAAGHAWVIPAEQDQRRFVEAIFNTPTELPMETFYDVSAWPLQHAFDLPFQQVRRIPDVGDALTTVPQPSVLGAPDTEALAWMVAWNQHHAPAILAALLADGYRVQVLEKPSTLATANGTQSFPRGSFFVHRGIQPENKSNVAERLAQLLDGFPAQIASLTRGMSAAGIDLGSPNAPVLKAPKPAMLTGDGVSSYGAGYAWFWFDQRLDQSVTRLDARYLPGNLQSYTHLILPPGNYGSMSEQWRDQIADYVRSGGQLIALGGAAKWVESLPLEWSFAGEKPETQAQDGEESEKQNAPQASAATERRAYADYNLDFARKIIGGSALDMHLDVTHPLGYGYQRDRITVFRQGAHVLKPTTNPYARPGQYAEQPLIAGYLSNDVQDKLKSTPALTADRFGQGLVVRIADDYLFRGYWAGTERIFANALFYGQLIGSTYLPQ